MCGILGIFRHGNLAPLANQLKSALDIVAHRGPDGFGYARFNVEAKTGVFCDNLPDGSALNSTNLVFGHRRLAIIDLSEHGRQPMTNHDRSLWITYNGEIYNYLEIRAELVAKGYDFVSRSDTEVILSAYEEWGEECVKRFNGMWAFAITDLRRGILFCSRDRFGIKPFHYYHTPHSSTLIFSSEIKQLLEFNFVPRMANQQGIYEYLTHGSFDHSEQTLFKEISRLPPGHNLRFDFASGDLSLSRFYRPQLTIDHTLTTENAARRFYELFSDSVRLQLRSDVPVGSCLSGGLDSSSIVCTMRNLIKQQNEGPTQHTFSSHFDDAEENELEYMQEVVRATGVDAHFVYPTAEGLIKDLEKLIWHQEEPFGSTSIFAQWSVYKLVHEYGIKVMLDGQGADEQLAGYAGFAYSYFQELLDKRKYWTLIAETAAYRRYQNKDWGEILPGMPGRVMRRFSRSRPSAPQWNWLSDEFSGIHRDQSQFVAYMQEKPFGDVEHLNNLCFQMALRINIPTLLRYEDRNSMAFSVEARVPFLDHRLVEFCLALPSRCKISKGYTKYAMRLGMRGVLPEKIRRRTSKLGFATPEARWQSSALKPLMLAAIHSPRLAAYLNVPVAEEYFKYIEQHRIRDFTPWRWANLMLWAEKYGIAAH